MKILIQSIDQIHVFLFDCEIKNIAIASDAVRMYGFGNYGNSFLSSPAQTDLSGSMGVFGSKYTHYIVIKICASGKRGICLYLNSFILAIINQLFRIAERMAFNLIYCRYNSGIGFQLFQMTDFKVADTDRKSPPGFLDFLQYFPGAEITSRNRPVDQIQINIIQFEPVQASFKSTLNVSQTLCGIPYFCSNKKFISRYSTAGDSPSYIFSFLYTRLYQSDGILIQQQK